MSKQDYEYRKQREAIKKATKAMRKTRQEKHDKWQAKEA